MQFVPQLPSVRRSSPTPWTSDTKGSLRYFLAPQLPSARRNSPTPWTSDIKGSLTYLLAEQPMVAHFRWDHDAWGSTWHFPLVAIAAYLLVILLLKILLIPRKRPLPLGPIPAMHNLCVVVASVVIFVGCWEATAVEIRDMRWIWRRQFKSGAEWVICFPLGARPSGRVFFWSYIFYLTKYHQLFDTVIKILRKKPLTFFHVFHRIVVVCVCYAWLEFSQSLQIVGVLTTTLLNIVVYSYYLCSSVGWRWFSQSSALLFPATCHMVHLAFTLLAYFTFLALHFTTRGGCNGMGAWLFDALPNATLFLFFVTCYLKQKKLMSQDTDAFSKSEGLLRLKQRCCNKSMSQETETYPTSVRLPRRKSFPGMSY